MNVETVYEEQAKIFKALSDKKRLMILELLRGGEKCACVLTDQIHMGQPALSYQMKILVASGIVESRQEGKWTRYSLSPEGCERAKRLFDEFTAASEGAVASQVLASAGEEALLCR